MRLEDEREPEREGDHEGHCVRKSAEPGLGDEQIHRAETRPLGAKLDEAGGLKVAVEGERSDVPACKAAQA
jgi:hypothetical protein